MPSLFFLSGGRRHLSFTGAWAGPRPGRPPFPHRARIEVLPVALTTNQACARGNRVAIAGPGGGAAPACVSARIRLGKKNNPSLSDARAVLPPQPPCQQPLSLFHAAQVGHRVDRGGEARGGGCGGGASCEESRAREGRPEKYQTHPASRRLGPRAPPDHAAFPAPQNQEQIALACHAGRDGGGRAGGRAVAKGAPGGCLHNTVKKGCPPPPSSVALFLTSAGAVRQRHARRLHQHG